jgi:hypothetical protein
VKVKPLEWQRIDGTDYAKAAWGEDRYAVWTEGRDAVGWWVFGQGNARKVDSGRDEAKAAAQADYTSRILSALDLSAIVPPPDEVVAWRCFHCDEVFTDEKCAREHFGDTLEVEPICQVTAERYREVERQLESYRNESDATSRTFYDNGHKAAVAERDAEQKGYDRGIADAKAYPETLGLIASPIQREATEAGDGYLRVPREPPPEVVYALNEWTDTHERDEEHGYSDAESEELYRIVVSAALSSVGATPPVTSDRASTQTDVSPTAAVPSQVGATPSALDLSASPAPVGEAVAFIVHDAEEGDYLTRSRQAADRSGFSVTPLYASTAVVSEPVREGWVLVPREPTPDMREAAAQALKDRGQPLVWGADATAIYRAMIAVVDKG